MGSMRQIAAKKRIADRYLQARPPAVRSACRGVPDPHSRFGIRISDNEDTDPARRGKVGKITVLLSACLSPGAAQSASLARSRLRKPAPSGGSWRGQLDKGIDPAVVEAEAREKMDCDLYLFCGNVTTAKSLRLEARTLRS